MDAQDYPNYLVDVLKESNNEADPTDKMDDRLMDIWCEKIHELATSKVQAYLIGKEDDYLLSETDMNELYEEAGMEYTQLIIDGLSDKGLVETVIDGDGDLAIRVTDLGRSISEDYKQTK